MKNPYSVIFLIIALAFMFGAGIFKGFFIPFLILFFVFRNSNKNKNDDRERYSRRDRRRYDPRNRRRKTDFDRRDEYQRPRPKPKPRSRKKPNPYKSSGVEKYKEYDYEGAIGDFKKALEIDPKDIPTHFNIACAYSLMENKKEAFYHLDKAVQIGYKDFDKIQAHDAFAFIRIQDDFEAFVKNGYRLTEKQEASSEKDISDEDIFEKLKKLADLRETGVLTEEEFLVQKEKLLK